MKLYLLSLAPLLLLLAVSCAVLRSARVGYMGGDVGAADGDHEITAMTLSVEPLAAWEWEDETAAPDIMLAEAIEQRDLARKQVAELSLMVADMEMHACEPSLCMAEHVEPHQPAWWEEPETFLYVVGALIALLGGAAGVKKRKKRLAEQQEST